MRTVLLLVVHFLTTLAKLVGPGGARSIIADSLLIKHQLIVINQPRQRAPNLTGLDRFLFGFWSLFMNPKRLFKSNVIFKTSTFLHFHKILVNRKYHRLFSSRKMAKPGPKGPSMELIRAIVELKQRNTSYGCPRIAQLISTVFGIEIDKDVVRRVLDKHYHPNSGGNGPSWLSFIGHAKDSLWSVDLFRCESILLKSHWVMVVMDQYTRRIIGFGIHAGAVDGPNLCWMFNRAIARMGTPTYLSTDHDPLFNFYRWHANLRILEIHEIKTIPYVPVSHPFVERLIGTLRREYLDQVLFWNAHDLEKKLDAFKNYYNGYRVHAALDGEPPLSLSGNDVLGKANINEYRWKSHCRDLFQTPIAA
ncbi:MAG: transposase [Nitrosomonas sp.]|nr:transposase [Nitrosomonas sp.]